VLRGLIPLPFLLLLAPLMLALPRPAAPASPDRPDWVRRSDAHTLAVVAHIGRFRPVELSGYGMTSFDAEIGDFAPGVEDRERAALQAALDELAQRRAAETDVQVRQDLAIVARALELDLRALELARVRLLPYRDLPEIIYRSLAQLLDDRLPPTRKAAAIERLRKYAGMATGAEPVTVLTERRVRTALDDPKRLGPSRAEIEQDLAQAKLLADGIAELFRKQQLDGWQEAHAALAKQLESYAGFAKAEVLPRARESFRLPADLYALALERAGVDASPDELAGRARAAIEAVQADMNALAGEVARVRGWPAGDYRDTLRRLKSEQIAGEAILPHYRQRLADVEAILRAHDIVSLPARPARMRLASVAESAANPAPRMEPPAFFGAAESHDASGAGEFVLPLVVPDGRGGAPLRYDDFSYAAVSWTIVAHELRPGHELQFAAMVERGVSLARAIFAFNSVNVEGWALYAEHLVRPYMPPEGRLASLQFLLLRVVRAWLDPALQLALVTPEAARRVLAEDVVLSPAMVEQELRRYMFFAPGQAASYWYGYTRMLALAAEVRNRQGPKSSSVTFHDALLAQGLLPPEELRRAVHASLGLEPR
jgi:hypothetical protein